MVKFFALSLLFVAATLLAVGNCQQNNDTLTCPPCNATIQTQEIAAEPCITPYPFEKNKTYHIILVFEPNINCSNVTASVSIAIAAFVFRLPEENICKFLVSEDGSEPGCPTDDKETLVVKYKVTVPEETPPGMLVNVTIELKCPPTNELILCTKFEATTK